MTSENPEPTQDETKPREATAPTTAPASAPTQATSTKNPFLQPDVLKVIIGGVVTIITTLSLPLITEGVKHLFPPAIDKMNSSDTELPKTTSVAEEGIANNMARQPETTDTLQAPTATLLPTNLPPTAIIIATDLPPTPTDLPTPTALPPTAEPSPTNTPVVASLLNCFTVDTWLPIDLKQPENNGCWDLSAWGFFAANGTLSISPFPTVNQTRGVYYPLSGNTVIQFTLQLSEFRKQNSGTAQLQFGIMQNNPFDRFTGGFFTFEQRSAGAATPVRLSYNISGQNPKIISDVDKPFSQTVKLVVEANYLTISLDGEPVSDPMPLTFSNRAFWIGYVLPANAQLNVTITDLSIQAP